MAGPVQYGGAWWTQREDGSWLKWNEDRGAWEEQSQGAPPPGSATQGPATQGPSPQAPAPYGAGQPGAYPGSDLAGWWSRAGALILDTLILLIPVVIVSIPFLAPIFSRFEEVQPGQTPDIGPLIGAYVGASLVGLIIEIAYFTYFHGRPQGQTLGKMALSIKVVDSNTRQSIGYGKAFLRILMIVVFGVAGSFLCGIVSLLDYLWPLWDQQNQSLHDKIANTLVVKA